MSHADPAELIESARSTGRGIGAFNAICLEHAEAIVEAAEEEKIPAILQISENTVAYHGGRIAPLAAACLKLIEGAAVPLALHLDHATTLDLCKEAADAGLRSVMFDASASDYDDNVRRTASASEWARSNGIWIEAELGEIGGKDGAHAPGVRTKPHEAAGFVEATGVNSLAVAIGTSHGMLDRSASLDLELLDSIAKEVSVPLVLHGSSGVSDTLLAAAVAHGMAKVNVATQLNQAFTRSVRTVLDGNTTTADPRTYLAPGRTSIVTTTRRLIRVLRGDEPAAWPQHSIHEKKKAHA